MIKYLLLGIGVLVNTAAWSFPYERVKSCFYAAEQGFHFGDACSE